MFLAVVGVFLGADFFVGGIVIFRILMYNVKKAYQRGGDDHRKEAYFEKDKDNLHARSGELYERNDIRNGGCRNERCKT